MWGNWEGGGVLSLERGMKMEEQPKTARMKTVSWRGLRWKGFDARLCLQLWLQGSEV